MNISRKIILSSLFVLALIISTPVAFSTTLGDQWDSLKASLSSAEKSLTKDESLTNLQTAKNIYTDNFKNAAISVDAESDILITNAFSNTESMLNTGNIEQASLNRQIIDKTIYKIAFMNMQLAITQNNSADFLSWLTVMEKKFKISENYSDINTLSDSIKSNSSLLSVKGPQITEKLLEIFKLKTVEELEEAIAALDKGDLKSAKTFTYEGLYYYRTLHPSIEEKIGAESANNLLDKMETAISVTMSDKSIDVMKSEITQISEDVELIIRQYEGGDVSELGLALSGIKDRLNLVKIEYLDAVKDGKIINQEEYDETIVFLTKAIEIFNSNKLAFTELSDSAAKSLEKNLTDIDSIVSAKGSTDEVVTLVEKSLANIATLQEFGGAVEIDILEYFDEIERLLNESKIAYRNGDTDMAFDLVTSAYLDNYEFVEGPLGEVDPELVLKIEIDMREKLRNMIKNNASPDNVDAQIDMILVDLAQAKKVIPEFGTIVMLILSVAIISIIGLTAKSRLSIRV
ncbi:conserved exported hypothetical protein [metagenome]